ncbi:hypothetical protein GJU40_07570 [Bacillus lacus]|uniref:Ferritin-like domain-containing protein n=1 Tax=Metabacillus lacus TaxID=1983721 RepID=A0A7X2IYL1_9BACI|nr:hypothetical protein [Metabacillus lacus]MRX72029.1 hypothetical protein [Metabacillus lacus]
MEQQQHTGSSEVIEQPPAVLTTKDHLYLSDMLTWNLLAMKKAHFFAGQCQDQQLKDALNQVGAMHSGHYERILTHLQSKQ